MPGSTRSKPTLPRASIQDGSSRFARFPTTEYFKLYHRIDIMLDPHPFAGGTTSCDSLYMGVPIVTLAGRNGVSRGGVSILSQIGLTDLIAQSTDDYIRIAARSPPTFLAWLLSAQPFASACNPPR